MNRPTFTHVAGQVRLEAPGQPVVADADQLALFDTLTEEGMAALLAGDLAQARAVGAQASALIVARLAAKNHQKCAAAWGTD